MKINFKLVFLVASLGFEFGFILPASAGALELVAKTREFFAGARAARPGNPIWIQEQNIIHISSADPAIEPIKLRVPTDRTEALPGSIDEHGLFSRRNGFTVEKARFKIDYSVRPYEYVSNKGGPFQGSVYRWDQQGRLIQADHWSPGLNYSIRQSGQKIEIANFNPEGFSQWDVAAEKPRVNWNELESSGRVKRILIELPEGASLVSYDAVFSPALHLNVKGSNGEILTQMVRLPNLQDSKGAPRIRATSMIDKSVFNLFTKGQIYENQI